MQQHEESERDYAYRIAEEHRVLAEHYLTRNARRWREHRDKAAAWTEYAVLLAEVPFAA